MREITETQNRVVGKCASTRSARQPCEALNERNRQFIQRLNDLAKCDSKKGGL